MPEHRKTKRFARILGTDIPEACGYLVRFWIWAFKYAGTDGEIKGDAEDLADGVGWDGDAQLFKRALHESGFLDDGDTVHAWGEYEGAYREKSEKDRDRQREKRAKDRVKKGASSDDAHVSRVTPRLEENREEKKRSEKIRKEEKTPAADLSPISEAEIAQNRAVIDLLQEYGIRATPEDTQAAIDLIDEYGRAAFEEAAEIAIKRGKAAVPYIRGILRNGGTTRDGTGNARSSAGECARSTGADRRAEEEWPGLSHRV